MRRPPEGRRAADDQCPARTPRREEHAGCAPGCPGTPAAKKPPHAPARPEAAAPPATTQRPTRPTQTTRSRPTPRPRPMPPRRRPGTRPPHPRRRPHPPPPPARRPHPRQPAPTRPPRPPTGPGETAPRRGTGPPRARDRTPRRAQGTRAARPSSCSAKCSCGSRPPTQPTTPDINRQRPVSNAPPRTPAARDADGFIVRRRSTSHVPSTRQTAPSKGELTGLSPSLGPAPEAHGRAADGVQNPTTVHRSSASSRPSIHTNSFLFGKYIPISQRTPHHLTHARGTSAGETSKLSRRWRPRPPSSGAASRASGGPDASPGGRASGEDPASSKSSPASLAPWPLGGGPAERSVAPTSVPRPGPESAPARTRDPEPAVAAARSPPRRWMKPDISSTVTAARTRAASSPERSMSDSIGAGPRARTADSTAC